MEKKVYEAPCAEATVFASQDAITKSDLHGTAGVNWDEKWFDS